MAEEEITRMEKKLFKKNLLIIPITGVIVTFIIALYSYMISTDASLTPWAKDYQSYTQEELGPINHYCGLIFGNMTSTQADVEGAIAVGGMFGEESYSEFGILGHYDVGAAYVDGWNYSPQTQLGAYRNEHNYPVVMSNTDRISVGGKIGAVPVGTWFGAYGGQVVLSEKNVDEYIASDKRFNGGDDDLINAKSTQRYTDTDTLSTWFGDAYSRVVAASNQYLTANDTVVPAEEFINGGYFKNYSADDFKNRTMVAPGEDSVAENILVVTVETSSTLLFSSQTAIVASGAWANEYDLIVINFPDAITVADGLNAGGFLIDGFDAGLLNTPPALIADNNFVEMRDNVASKYVYNFPNATDIKIQSVWIGGSIIAPQASFHGIGGSVNGQLICKDFYQEAGFELHAYGLTDRYFDVADPEYDGSTYDVDVTKKLYFNYERNTLLQGARFQLLTLDESGEYVPYKIVEDEEEVPFIFETDNYGTYTIKGLPPGKYRLVEIEAPMFGQLNEEDADNEATYFQYDFELPDEDEEFEGDEYSRIDSSGKVHIERYNGPELFPVNIKKIGADNTLLENAVFTVYREPDQYFSERTRIVIEQGTDIEGLLRMKLPIGRYSIVENEAPEGYALINGEISFTVDTDGKVVDLYDSRGDEKSTISYETEDDHILSIITIANEAGIALNTVTINKIDEDIEGVVLQGAIFELYKYDSEEDVWERILDNGVPESSEYYQSLSSIKTDGNGRFVFENLQAGLYRLVEIKAPSGFQISNKYQESPFGEYAYEFEIEGSSNGLEGFFEGGYSSPVLWETDIEEESEEQETQEYIENKILGEENIQTEEPQETEMNSGASGNTAEMELETEQEEEETFAVQETEEDIGETNNITDVLDPQIAGVTNALSQMDNMSIVIPNKRLFTGIKLRKTSNVLSADEAGLNADLSGARFGLYIISSDSGTRHIETKTTDQDGYIEFEGLQEAEYILRELTSLNGHEAIDEDISFKVNFTDAGVEVTLNSAPANVAVDSNGDDEEYPFLITVENRAYLGSLKVYKRDSKTYQEGQENPVTGEPEGVKFIFEYLEGAVFRIERKNKEGQYESFALMDPTAKPVQEEMDADGNLVSYAVFEGLPAGEYRLVEVEYPEGYEPAYGNDIVGNFTISARDAENQHQVEMVISNSKTVAKSTIKVQKIDRSNNQPLEKVEFRLWELTGAAEEWPVDFDLETIAVDYNSGQIKIAKYAAGSEYITDAEGYLYLHNLEAGVYGLAEIIPPEEYMFVLDERATVAGSTFSLDYYYQTTVFKVVEVEEGNTDAGVRIQWVHQLKIENDEARYRNDLHDIDSSEWSPTEYAEYGTTQPDEEYDDTAYRSFRITNRKVEIPDITFNKIDSETGQGLGGAQFTLYMSEDELDEEDPDQLFQFNKEIGTYTSEDDGTVYISFTEEEKEMLLKKVKGAQTTIGRFKLEETQAPIGYEMNSAPVYFEIAINSSTKATDIYALNEKGQNIMIDSGTIFGDMKKPLFSGYKDPEHKGEKGEFFTILGLADVHNNPKRGGFQITKQLSVQSIESESFVFQIQRIIEDQVKETFYSTITIDAGDTTGTITVADVPYGIYRITELGTNWRYVLDQNDEELDVTISDETIENGSNKVTFKNKKDNDHWLSGKAKVTNTMDNPTKPEE